MFVLERMGTILSKSTREEAKKVKKIKPPVKLRKREVVDPTPECLEAKLNLAKWALAAEIGTTSMETEVWIQERLDRKEESKLQKEAKRLQPKKLEIEKKRVEMELTTRVKYRKLKPHFFK